MTVPGSAPGLNTRFFIHAGGLQGEANIFISRPSALRGKLSITADTSSRTTTRDHECVHSWLQTGCVVFSIVDALLDASSDFGSTGLLHVRGEGTSRGCRPHHFLSGPDEGYQRLQVSGQCGVKCRQIHLSWTKDAHSEISIRSVTATLRCKKSECAQDLQRPGTAKHAMKPTHLTLPQPRLQQPRRRNSCPPRSRSC